MSTLPATILIADPDGSRRQHRVTLLREAGYDTVTAATSAEILARVNAASRGSGGAAPAAVDLLLVEATLPDGDAVTLCDGIKKETPTAPAIILCGGPDTSSETEAEALERCADDFIRRPISDRELLARVQALLRLKAVEARLAEEEQRNRLLFETLPLGVSFHDAQGRILAANPALMAVLPSADEGIVASGPEEWLQFGPPIDPDGSPFTVDDFAVARALRTGEEVRGLVIGIRRDGARRWLRVDAIPLFRSDAERPHQVYTLVEDITEQRQAEEALAFQSQLLQSVRDAIVATDNEGRITYWGPGAAAMLGYDAGEIVGRSASLLVAPDWREQQAQGFHGALNSGRHEAEYLLRRADGSFVWASVAVSRVSNAAGETTGVVAVGRDISEQRRSQRQQEVVAAIAQALRSPLSEQEMGRLVLAFLQAPLELIGAALVTRAEGAPTLEVIAGRGLLSSLEGEAVEPTAELTQALAAAEKASTAEAGHPIAGLTSPFGHPDLPPEPAHSALVVPLQAAQATLGYLWLLGSRQAASAARSEGSEWLPQAAGDLLAAALQRQRLLRQLRTQARRLQWILDTMSEGLVLLDPRQRIVLANPAAAGYLSLLSPSSGPGARLDRLGGPEGLAVERLLREQPGIPAEVVIDGAEQRIFELNALPMSERAPAPARQLRPGGPFRKSAEQEAGWVLVIREITQRRQIEEQTRQQERLAALGQLAAGIAHDFNNVMASIMLYGEMIHHRAAKEGQDAKAADVIIRQARHGSELVGKILDFSRRSVLRRTELEVRPFFYELLELWRRTLPKNIVVSLDIEGDYTISADPTSIQQALMNLAINARDAMPGGGRLSVHVSDHIISRVEAAQGPALGAGEWLRISVSDTGHGIPEEILPYIFDPFFTTRGSGTTAEGGIGTGLGLAQVYGIVKQHNGHTTVASDDSGTTFTIYLPLLEKMEGEDVEPRRSPEPEASPPPGGSPPSETAPGAKDAAGPESARAPTGETATAASPGKQAAVGGERAADSAGAESAAGAILVVDDEAPVREAVVEILRAAGYHVVGAASAQEALAALEEGAVPDLVLTDMVMPGMSGAMFVRRLRHTHPELPVLVMSGYPRNAGGPLREMEVGWLKKPFDLDELLENIEALLAERG